MVLAMLCVGMMGCAEQSEGRGNEQKEEGSRKAVVKAKKKQVGTPPLTIYLYDDFPWKRAEELAQDLRVIFPKVTISDLRLRLPAKAYNKVRNRYLGSALLDDLRTRLNGDVALGLTDEIIYKPNEISGTYGIMGVSYVNRNVAVSSLTIPRSGAKQDRKTFFKLTLHEVGHAYGLPHCPNQKCIMVDAEHRNKLKNITSFCADCKAKLVKRGWKIK